MVRVKVITIDKPDCFVGIDLVLFHKIKKACDTLRDSKCLLIPCGEIVAQMVLLYDCNDNLVRLRILSVINPNTFKCLIIDHGRIEEVQRNRLYVIPPNALYMDPAVKLYKIPGIIPAGLNISNEGASIKASLSQSTEWIRASYKFVGRIFRENSVVFVSYLKEYSKDKVFADVWVDFNHQRENLKDLLIRENYAFAINEDRNDEIGSRLSNVSLNGNDQNVDDDYPYSLSGESISKILEESHDEDEDNDLNTGKIVEPHYLMIAPENYDSLSANKSTIGTLDEISFQVLDNKVKSWFITKSIEINSNDESVIKYDYKNPIRPILSYQKDEMIAAFLKDTMVHYKTKLLLLIQSLMIPSILRGINLVAIAPPKKGKSLGLIMPILQKIATKPVSRTRSFNPIAIIICTSWTKVKELSDSAKLFVGFINETNRIRKPKIVSAYGGQTERKIMIPILAGCDILIITPKCLLRLLKSHEFFKLNELEIMALDDAENLIAHHLEVLKEIFIYKQSGSYESGIGVLQLVTATNWTSGLQSFMQNEMGDMFMLTVNNPLEIAVFERLKQKLIEYNDNPMELYQQILTYVEMKESTIKRTIIFASDDRQIRVIYRYLMQKVTFDLKVMLGSMSGPELKQVEQEWNQYRGYVNMPILLISDEALGTSDVSIFNAQTIIHADINPPMFGSRLNFLRDQFKELSFLQQHSATENTKDQSLYHSYILVCPSTIHLSHANFLYKFLGRCHCDRPTWLQEKAIDYILNKEKSKLVNAICPHIKVKGECQFPACNKRHIVLSDIDTPLLPNMGQIKFRLLHLESPSNFFVRIMEHKVSNESPNSDYKCQYTSLKMNIIKYFSDPKNIQGVNPKFIKPGFIAAIRQRDMLERVMIRKCKYHRSARIDVYLIDHGSRMFVEQADLLILPKDLTEIPAQAVEVFVIGIRPLDNDEFYNEESCKFVQSFLDGRDLYGVIMLCIGKTIWLDSVTQLVHHKTTNISVYEKNLAIELTEKALVEKNPGHIQKLIRLCTGKIDIWNSASQTESRKPIPIMRKFTYTNEPLRFEVLTIQGDDDDTQNDCTVLRIMSPNVIFLSNRDTKESIKQMQKEIKSLIDSIETIPMKSLKISSRVLFCLNSDWLRGYVLKVESDSVIIFSLDWGSLVKYTPEDYVLKKLPTEYQELPYHVIMAGLCHCSPGEPFSGDINTVIENFVSSSDKKILLFVTAYSAEKVDPSSLFLDTADNILTFHNTEICRSLKRYSVSIAKHVAKGDREELFNVLVQRHCVVPSQSWIHIVLPESQSSLSRLERSSSIPNLGSDILYTRDTERRLKLSMNMERLILKNISYFESKEFVSSNIDAILNTLLVLLHFVSEQPVFMCYYRSLTALLNLAYTSKLPMRNPLSEEEFSIAYISDILYSYQSIVLHILNHLNTTIRNNKIEDGGVFLEMLKLLLVNTGFANNFFEQESWVCVMATCIGMMQDNDRLYNGLMDILVQLVMLSATNESALLAGIVAQCCKTVEVTESISVWNSSMALISCLINSKSYYPVFRDLGFFTVLLNKTVKYFHEQGCWTEMHESSFELLRSMWRNSSVDRRQLIRDRSLSTIVRSILELMPLGNESLAKFLTDIMLEESSNRITEHDATGDDTNTSMAPDADALDWITMKNNTLLKKHKRCYKKIFEDKNLSDSSDDKQSLESDSDSSNVEVTSFLNNTNPADEDNVLCYDRA